MNHPLFLDQTIWELQLEWMEDEIESFAVENKIQDVSEVEYRAVFPHDTEAGTDSLDTIIDEMIERFPEKDLEEVMQIAEDELRARVKARRKKK